VPDPVLAPRSAEDLAAIVTWAAGEEEPVEIVAHGSKRGLGRPVQASHTLDLSALSGIIFYEPEELVLKAAAATPIALIRQTLAQSRQHLAFEPPDWGPLYGAPADQGTLGGAIAVNAAGPRRIKAGAARDHILGFAAVSGRGERFKGGGRVMKNVTGYDLPKLMTGSHGTLAVLTEITLKVLPAPEAARTLILPGLDDGSAIRALSQALGSAHEVTGAAHLPAGIAAGCGVPAIAAAAGAVTAIRVEGIASSCDYRLDRLRLELAGFAAGSALDSADSERLWRELAELRPFLADRRRPLWRISVAPGAAAALVGHLAGRLRFDHFYDWGGGLVWLALEAGADPAAEAIRAALPAGHATLMRADAALRAHVAVFQPQPPAMAALTRRVKEAFDPRHVLNPGRMYPGL
jgi:glycolate dehydrogenase FAD-binding subunit